MVRERLRAAERALLDRWTPDRPVPAEGRSTAGLEAVRARTEAVDEAVRALWAAEVGDRPGLAAIALGGYGRRELCPHSDVDVLFLRAEGAGVAGLEPLQAGLWDLGLRLGAAVRTVGETIDLARGDLATRTSLLEARLLVGDPALGLALEAALDRHLDAVGRAAFVEETAAEVRRRRARHGGVPGLAEPNVKEGPGGLRDAHAAFWVGRAVFGARDLRDLAPRGALAADAAADLAEAYALLLLVRWLLHARVGRKADVLTLEAREETARRMGLEAPTDAVREVVRAMGTVARLADQVLRRAASAAAVPPRAGGRRIEAEVEERGGEVFVPAAAIRPAAAVRAATAAAREGLPLAPETFEAIRAAGRGWSEADCDADAAAAFRALLAGPRSGDAVAVLHATGALRAVLPEFERIEGLAGVDVLHRYTADAHTIEALRVFDRLTEEAAAASAEAEGPGAEPGRSPVARALAAAGPREVLALAILLHDIGKGVAGPGDHVEKSAAVVPRVASRLGLAPEEAATVEFLVREHLLMTRTAFRRDVDDPHLVREFADRLGAPDRLAALYLLTICDVRAVSPDRWNDWKGTLLATLFLRTLRALEVRTPPESIAREAARRRREAVEAQLGDEVEPAEIDRHFETMPPRYFLAFAPAQIAHHLCLVPRLADRPFVLDLYHHTAIGYTEVIVVTRTRVGLFSEIVGTLASRGINILSARIQTRADGLAFDVFRVNDRPGREGRPVVDAARWRGVREDLSEILSGRTTVEALLAGRAPYAARPRPAAGAGGVRVGVDDEASPTQTVVEVEAPDEVGLLYKIASAIRAAGAGVTAAIVDTERGRAFDVFYVADAVGRKLEPGAARDLAGRIEAAIA